MLTPEEKKRRAELMRQAEASREITHLESRGEWFAAFGRVAELFHCRESLPDETREFVNERISELRGHPERIAAIVGGYTGDRDRLARILSIGENFNEDEMLLVVGLRHRLELGNEVLTETGLGTRTQTADVDELIDHCLGSSSNRIGFQRAVRAAKCAGAGWANLSNKDLRARRRKTRTRQCSGVETRQLTVRNPAAGYTPGIENPVWRPTAERPSGRELLRSPGVGSSAGATYRRLVLRGLSGTGGAAMGFGAVTRAVARPAIN